MELSIDILDIVVLTVEKVLLKILMRKCIESLKGRRGK